MQLIAYPEKSSNQITVQTWFDLGDKLHPDNNVSIASLPSSLFAAEWIKMPAMLSQTLPLSFKLNNETDLYVPILNNSTEPLWMDGFIDTNTLLTTDQSGGTSYKVFTKRFLQGTVISIPSGDFINHIIPWYIASQPVFNLQQAIDQRPITTISLKEAVTKATSPQQTYRERNFVMLQAIDHSTITWPLSTGLAGIYTFQIKYFHNQPDTIKGRLTLKTHDGIIMMTRLVDFLPMKSDKTWRGLRTDTQNTINAGNYTLTLELIENESELSIGELEVQ
jgi:beta-galactosidase